ncbi:uncharacterized protein G2W53_032662 [Senna tora]|uniref:Uncharacterized protein n=1 Tax=Senna tora TaxID=362788 RepID=A0A834WAE3_9FABA|nr:uncharacterized protein G2W53_032662 [Senna tora]
MGGGAAAAGKFGGSELAVAGLMAVREAWLTMISDRGREAWTCVIRVPPGKNAKVDRRAESSSTWMKMRRMAHTEGVLHCCKMGE